MLPRFIDSWDGLPRAAQSDLQERLWFDVKATYPPNSRAEMAKDVAAFANALGGAIIIGASEGPTEPDYSSPLPLDLASKIEDEFDKSVRDFCCPSPTVHVRSIPTPTHEGRVIIVVNIEPSIDQPVAARHETDVNMWRFPQHRHLPVKEQSEALNKQLKGHYSYYGVTGNYRALQLLQQRVERIWHRWLGRRSSRPMPWARIG